MLVENLGPVATKRPVGCGMASVCPGNHHRCRERPVAQQRLVEVLFEHAPACFGRHAIAHLVDFGTDSIDDLGFVRRQYLGSTLHRASSVRWSGLMASRMRSTIRSTRSWSVIASPSIVNASTPPARRP